MIIPKQLKKISIQFKHLGCAENFLRFNFKKFQTRRDSTQVTSSSMRGLPMVLIVHRAPLFLIFAIQLILRPVSYMYNNVQIRF